MITVKTSSLTGHTEGLVYFSNYWCKEYTVTKVHDSGWVTVVWEDGHSTTHCTSLSYGNKTDEVFVRECDDSFPGDPCTGPVMLRTNTHCRGIWCDVCYEHRIQRFTCPDCGE